MIVSMLREALTASTLVGAMFFLFGSVYRVRAWCYVGFYAVCGSMLALLLGAVW